MLSVISDVHIGALRSGGTTPASAFKLRLSLLSGLGGMLATIDTDLLINGDLFDTGNIPMSDLLECYNLLCNWLGKGFKLYLSAGNHDLSKSSLNLSSFQFLCKLLVGNYPDNVIAIQGALALPEHDAYVISHVPNQDLFDIELAKIPACKFLFLHCNYDNKFAMESDHSLNLSPDQARAAPVETIILGHEHQKSNHLAGKVVIVGNQLPSSIADCLGNIGKYMIRVGSGAIEYIPTWLAEGSFSRQDWQSLVDEGDFIRVEGTATAEQASAVVTAISKFRSSSEALVITNAVAIQGVDNVNIEVTLEQIQGFSVLDALLATLTNEEATVVKRLMTEYSVS
jgi:UDP-2,3-diacylglucosamine pyrophosphatase LpxH